MLVAQKKKYSIENRWVKMDTFFMVENVSGSGKIYRMGARFEFVTHFIELGRPQREIVKQIERDIE